jgi:hypothetical protein
MNVTNRNPFFPNSYEQFLFFWGCRCYRRRRYGNRDSDFLFGVVLLLLLVFRSFVAIDSRRTSVDISILRFHVTNTPYHVTIRYDTTNSNSNFFEQVKGNELVRPGKGIRKMKSRCHIDNSPVNTTTPNMPRRPPKGRKSISKCNLLE